MNFIFFVCICILAFFSVPFIMFFITGIIAFFLFEIEEKNYSKWRKK